ncbi:hypothetical protein ACFV4K_19865 [Nocardia sp. NPDC059764]|uniref:hypothetical protein n=1 Tax=Nocardia sp. NPDC059764 TaxID=3346939 RepID=UPI00365307C1
MAAIQDKPGFQPLTARTDIGDYGTGRCGRALPGFVCESERHPDVEQDNWFRGGSNAGVVVSWQL